MLIEYPLCLHLFTIIQIVIVPLFTILFTIGAENMSNPYSCPKDTVLYRPNVCIYPNDTLVIQEYNKSLYDNGVNMIIMAFVLFFMYIFLHIFYYNFIYD